MTHIKGSKIMMQLTNGSRFLMAGLKREEKLYEVTAVIGVSVLSFSWIFIVRLLEIVNMRYKINLFHPLLQ